MRRTLLYAALGGTLGLLGVLATASGFGVRGAPDGRYPIPRWAEPTEGTRSELEQLASVRVYFEHMSVGSNIVSGVDADIATLGVRWSSEALDSNPRLEAPVRPGFFHTWFGASNDPVAKIQRFAEDFRGLQGPKPSIALMKLCFVDIVGRTDAAAVFDTYRVTIRSLQKDFPETQFIHVTVPLSIYPTNLKARVFRIMGRSPWEDAGNVRRAEYNALLRQEFAAEPIFDLARVESTLPDGSRHHFTADGRAVEALVPEYASDSEGHLSVLGQQQASRALVKVLAAAAQSSRGAPSP